MTPVFVGATAADTVQHWAAMLERTAEDCESWQRENPNGDSETMRRYRQQAHGCRTEAAWARDVLKNAEFDAKLAPALAAAEKNQPGVTWRFIDAALSAPRDGHAVALWEARRADEHADLVNLLSGELCDRLMRFQPSLVAVMLPLRAAAEGASDWLKSHPPKTSAQTAGRKKGKAVAAPYVRALAEALSVPRTMCPFPQLPGYDRPRGVALDVYVKSALASWVRVALNIDVTNAAIVKALTKRDDSIKK